MSDSSHSVEVERKYDVDHDTPLPDWMRLPGVVSIGEAELRPLDAQYFDTADLALARQAIALRRRTGGPDEGWHVKTAAADGRHEWHWPLGAPASGEEVVPDGVVEALAPYAQPPFLPLARLHNPRHAYALRDEAGALVAEAVDDRVSGRAERTGHEESWREWEVELGPAAPADHAAFFAAVDELVLAAGGRRAASDSKLQRILAS